MSAIREWHTQCVTLIIIQSLNQQDHEEIHLQLYHTVHRTVWYNVLNHLPIYHKAMSNTTHFRDIIHNMIKVKQSIGLTNQDIILGLNYTVRTKLGISTQEVIDILTSHLEQSVEVVNVEAPSSSSLLSSFTPDKMGFRTPRIKLK